MRVLQENPEGIGFPRCAPKVRDSFTIQPGSDALGASPLIGKLTENTLHNGDLFRRAGDKSHVLVGKALALAVGENLFRISLGIE